VGEFLAANTKRDYYEVLGVTRASTDVEIKSAYRKLAMTYHPDRNPNNPEAEDKFKEITEAYAILADSEKRSLYDRFGHAGVGGNAGARPDSIPRSSRISATSLATSSGSTCSEGRAAAAVAAARSVEPTFAKICTLEFEEAVFGVEKEVKVRRHETCETCHGNGAASGKAPVACKSCQGRGQVRYQQGFFSIARTCPTCQGAGSVITDPCTKCKR
jgi:molecular chaperone DnaJ